MILSSIPARAYHMQDVFQLIDKRKFEGRYHPWVWGNTRFCTLLFNMFKHPNIQPIRKKLADIWVSTFRMHCFIYSLVFWISWVVNFLFASGGNMFSPFPFVECKFIYQDLFFGLTRAIIYYGLFLVVIFVDILTGFVTDCAWRADLLVLPGYEFYFGWVIGFQLKLALHYLMFLLSIAIPSKVLSNPDHFNATEILLFFLIIILIFMVYRSQAIIQRQSEAILFLGALLVIQGPALDQIENANRVINPNNLLEM